MDSLIQNVYAQVGGGCCSFIWIGLTIWAMVHTLGSRASATVKVLWILGCGSFLVRIDPLAVRRSSAIRPLLNPFWLHLDSEPCPSSHQSGGMNPWSGDQSVDLPLPRWHASSTSSAAAAGHLYQATIRESRGASRYAAMVEGAAPSREAQRARCGDHIQEEAV